MYIFTFIPTNWALKLFLVSRAPHLSHDFRSGLQLQSQEVSCKVYIYFYLYNLCIIKEILNPRNKKHLNFKCEIMGRKILDLNRN